MLNAIINWYSKRGAVVRWKGIFSEYFSMTSGVRQDWVLSPFLFAIYVDDVIINLHDQKLGCVLGATYIRWLMYADDLVLLSASVSVLQKMVDVCEQEMKFNTSKSMVLRIGRACKKCVTMLSLATEIDARRIVF